MKEFSVATASMIAAGKESISISSLRSFLLTKVYKIASSTLSSARSRMLENSGFAKSSIFKFSFLTYSAVSLRNGYFAKSFLVKETVVICILFSHYSVSILGAK